MELFVLLDETYDLGLVDDKSFLTRVLPLVTGSLLNFVGNCLTEGLTWAESKTRLLEDYFPYFVRERLIRERVVFNLHQQEQPLRQYIQQIFRVAKFLKYPASEEQLVDRVIMNFHPSVSAHTGLLDRPKSLKELLRVVGLIEEKAAITRERFASRAAPPGPRRNHNERLRSPRHTPTPGDNVGVGRCWNCGQQGHLRRNCPGGTARSGNGPAPGGQGTPGQEC
jgi:hypothetical protein